MTTTEAEVRPTRARDLVGGEAGSPPYRLTCAVLAKGRS